MNDMAWYVRERVNEAYQSAENRRLARDARQSGPGWTVNPHQLRVLFQAFGKAIPRFSRIETPSTRVQATDN